MQFPKKEVFRSKASYQSYAKENSWCEWPGHNHPRWLGPHHIIFRSQGGSDDHSNLISLCKEIHDQAHGKDSREIREKLLKLKSST